MGVSMGIEHEMGSRVSSIKVSRFPPIPSQVNQHVKGLNRQQTRTHLYRTDPTSTTNMRHQKAGPRLETIDNANDLSQDTMTQWT